VLRTVDWAETPLGPVSQWPTDLVRAAHTVVRSPAPAVLWWGDRFVQIHNDALIASLGGDEPAVARPAKECWPERWEVLRPLATEVLRTGEIVTIDDLVLPVDGNPSTYWTMSLAPLDDETGRATGVLSIGMDLTARVTTRELERRSADAATANLQVALASNRRIGTAIGILMAHQRITDAAAFELLREASQRTHRKLRDIAEDVVLTGTLPD
jgi:PAS domain-containing protein